MKYHGTGVDRDLMQLCVVIEEKDVKWDPMAVDKHELHIDIV